jgi:hypothetical protein
MALITVPSCLRTVDGRHWKVNVALDATSTRRYPEFKTLGGVSDARE